MKPEPLFRRGPDLALDEGGDAGGELVDAALFRRDRHHVERFGVDEAIAPGGDPQADDGEKEGARPVGEPRDRGRRQCGPPEERDGDAVGGAGPLVGEDADHSTGAERLQKRPRGVPLAHDAASGLFAHRRQARVEEGVVERSGDDRHGEAVRARGERGPLPVPEVGRGKEDPPSRGGGRAGVLEADDLDSGEKPLDRLRLGAEEVCGEAAEVAEDLPGEPVDLGGGLLRKGEREIAGDEPPSTAVDEPVKEGDAPPEAVGEAEGKDPEQVSEDDVRRQLDPVPEGGPLRGHDYEGLLERRERTSETKDGSTTRASTATRKTGARRTESSFTASFSVVTTAVAPVSSRARSIRPTVPGTVRLVVAEREEVRRVDPGRLERRAERAGTGDAGDSHGRARREVHRVDAPPLPVADAEELGPGVEDGDAGGEAVGDLQRGRRVGLFRLRDDEEVRPGECRQRLAEKAGRQEGAPRVGSRRVEKDDVDLPGEADVGEAVVEEVEIHEGLERLGTGRRERTPGVGDDRDGRKRPGQERRLVPGRGDRRERSPPVGDDDGSAARAAIAAREDRRVSSSPEELAREPADEGRLSGPARRDVSDGDDRAVRAPHVEDTAFVEREAEGDTGAIDLRERKEEPPHAGCPLLLRPSRRSSASRAVRSVAPRCRAKRASAAERAAARSAGSARRRARAVDASSALPTAQIASPAASTARRMLEIEGPRTTGSPARSGSRTLCPPRVPNVPPRRATSPSL